MASGGFFAPLNPPKADFGSLPLSYPPLGGHRGLGKGYEKGKEVSFGRGMKHTLLITLFLIAFINLFGQTADTIEVRKYHVFIYQGNHILPLGTPSVVE